MENNEEQPGTNDELAGKDAERHRDAEADHGFILVERESHWYFPYQVGKAGVERSPSRLSGLLIAIAFIVAFGLMLHWVTVLPRPDTTHLTNQTDGTAVAAIHSAATIRRIETKIDSLRTEAFALRYRADQIDQKADSLEALIPKTIRTLNTNMEER